ncbi:MAG: MarR family transcriptional regulator [Solobacterium sp.]|nr:MarR family transcriptional regulator [Solobacterium sp.]
MSDPALKLENQLCFPLYAAARKVTALYTPLLKPLGLTYTQYLVMMVLWEQDGIRIGEIGERLCLDTGTLTPLLKKMEQEGLLSRTRCAEDERAVIIRLSEKGKALEEKAAHIPAAAGSCISLEPEKAVQLYALLHEILNQ